MPWYYLISLLMVMLAGFASAKTPDVKDARSLLKRYESAQQQSDVVKFRLGGCQVLVLLTKKGGLGFVYLIPDAEELREKDTLTRFAQRLHREWQPSSPLVPVVVDDRATYAQMVYASQQDETSLLLGTRFFAACHLNARFGPPLYWKDGRLVWRGLFNKEKSGLFVTLNPHLSSLSAIEMKWIGDKLSKSELIAAVNDSLGTSVRQAADFREVREWSAQTGYPSNKLYGVEAVDTGKTVKRGKRVEPVMMMYYLVKDGDYMMLATASGIKSAPKDEKSWLSYAPITFPDDKELFMLPEERSAQGDDAALPAGAVDLQPGAESDVHQAPSPAADEANKGKVAQGSEAKELPATKPQKEIEQKVLSFDEAMEAYIQSLSVEAANK